MYCLVHTEYLYIELQYSTAHKIYIDMNDEPKFHTSPPLVSLLCFLALWFILMY